jgi:hypothetical protein
VRWSSACARNESAGSGDDATLTARGPALARPLTIGAYALAEGVLPFVIAARRGIVHTQKTA